MGFGYKDKFCSFRAGYHDTGTAQDVGLEDRAIPLSLRGKEDIGVLRVELECFTHIRPSHGAGREWQTLGAIRSKEFEEGLEEKSSYKQ
jgi:hypothetical protein